MYRLSQSELASTSVSFATSALSWCVKVILSLLCPLYILQLEFKSKEELQLMPQTEEEHLENESIEDDRSTKDPTDAEVSFRVLLLTILASYPFGSTATIAICFVTLYHKHNTLFFNRISN